MYFRLKKIKDERFFFIKDERYINISYFICKNRSMVIIDDGMVLWYVFVSISVFKIDFVK